MVCGTIDDLSTTTVQCCYLAILDYIMYISTDAQMFLKHYKFSDIVGNILFSNLVLIQTFEKSTSS